LAGIPGSTSARVTALRPSRPLKFSPTVLEEYKADYKDLFEFKGKDRFPVRAAVVEAVEALLKSKETPMRQTLPAVMGKQLIVLKQQVLMEQKMLAEQRFHLKEALSAMLEANGQRAGETKRWQVLYDFVLLRLKSRLVHLTEYNYRLGQFRSDYLDELGAGDKHWRLSPQDELATTEVISKQLRKEIKKGWVALINNYPDSPWALQAQRESSVPLGLTLQPAKD
jgi:hypothetical protein